MGMGKIKEKVKSLMPNGNLIACDVAADYAVTAGMFIRVYIPIHTLYANNIKDNLIPFTPLP